MANPITTALARVPKPGFCRMGIHSSSTTTETSTMVTPKLNGSMLARPWCNTSGVEAHPGPHHHAHREAVEQQPGEQSVNRRGRRSAGIGVTRRPSQPNGRRDEAGEVRDMDASLSRLVCHFHSQSTTTGLGYPRWLWTQQADRGTVVTMTSTRSAVVARVSAAGLAKHVKIGRPGTVPTDQEGRGGVTYRELARRIRDALLDGRLAVHTQLPSERALADALQLSRTTVTAAYALLRQEGWVASRRGSGSVLQPAPGVPNGSWATMWAPTGDDAPINLTTASLPAPADHVEQAVRDAVDDLSRYFGHDGYEPLGIPALRESIARRYTEGGLPTTPDEILVTNGGQHAWTIVLTELSGPGDRVLLECPTYPLALEAVRSGRRIPVPVGLRPAAAQPWDLDLMTSAMVQSAPRLAYLIPDFHNPTGAVMSAAVRADLIGTATRTATVLVVDETLRDVGFDDTRPVPAHAASFDRTRRVITVGSMSKSFWGGLRIGWLRANRTLVERLAAVRSLQDMAGSVLDQLVANRLLTEHPGALEVQRARFGPAAAPCSTLSARNFHIGGLPGRPAARRSGLSCPARTPPSWPGSRRPPAWRSCPARGSARTAPWSPTCGCRSPCRRTRCGWPCTGWP